MKTQVWQCACGSTSHHARGQCRACYQRAKAKQKAYGRWESTRVDPSRARAHLAAAREAGLLPSHVAAAVGLNHLVVSHAADEDTITISRETEAAILSFEIPERAADAVPDEALVPVLGSRRRIQALIADGHPQKYLAERLGYTLPHELAPIIGKPQPDGRTRERISAGRDRQIRELFDELQLVPGTSERARLRGERMGWPRSWEWDEDQIDRPDGQPVRALRTPWAELQAQRAERREQRQARNERVIELSRYCTDGRIAELVGISDRHVSRIKAEHRRMQQACEEVIDTPTEDENTELIELTEDE